MAPHNLEEGLPREGTLELKQPVVVVHRDRDNFAVCGCVWADPRHTMASFFHDVLLREDIVAYL
jgi:hypothetical protein